METTKTRFAFTSEGETLVGNLYLPEESGRPVSSSRLGRSLRSRSKRPAPMRRRWRSAGTRRSHSTTGTSVRAAARRGSSQTPMPTSKTSGDAGTALLADERLTRPAPLRPRCLLRRGSDGAFGRRRLALPCLCRRGRCVHRPCEECRGDRGLRIKRRSIGAALPNGSGGRQATRRRSRRSRPTAAMWPCRYGRRTSSTERLAARCRTT